ncbi:MAG: hypothetical protein C4532_08390 [Candidatus Abyssobacteria bacterium SURF_17]|jgi:hypothetical protein|uniref:Uncharacterized protein n=1 Tax=Candidatus Abyssobacteria bacterium SURF_17 TaxID=2093361 RepID=A0A419EZL8_9BACT|nr:MAG: hypothetical protein C4532_08390 [Candidatus Abyssubacteria bacterium SURF_17]
MTYVEYLGRKGRYSVSFLAKIGTKHYILPQLKAFCMKKACLSGKYNAKLAQQLLFTLTSGSKTIWRRMNIPQHEKERKAAIAR